MGTFFFILGKTEVEGIHFECLGKIYLLKIAKKLFVLAKCVHKQIFTLKRKCLIFFWINTFKL